MTEVLIDALLDSLKILAVLVVVNIIIGFFESKITNTLEKSKHWSPLVGSVFGLLPQCGFSVISTDLYNKKHITMGTLIAVYISTSDEALSVLISYPDKILSLLSLLGLKLLIGVCVGYFVDLLISRREEMEVLSHIHNKCSHEEETHVGCCHHTIEDENKIHRYILHPVIHSLKIFLYVLVINIVFGTLLYLIGEDKFTTFLTSNRYLAPLLTVIVGLIPNCASSILIANLYILGGINFGALLSGLIVNAGLGVMILLRNKKNIKDSIIIVVVLIVTGLLSGYISTIIGF